MFQVKVSAWVLDFPASFLDNDNSTISNAVIIDEKTWGNNSGTDNYSAEKVLTDSGEYERNFSGYWLGFEKSDSYFIVDLHNVYNIREYNLRNTHNNGSGDRWTTKFKISVSLDNVNFIEHVSDTIEIPTGSKQQWNCPLFTYGFTRYGDI